MLMTGATSVQSLPGALAELTETAPFGSRLKGYPRMEVAIGARFGGIIAAEMEILGQWIAIWPFAGALAEINQLQAARNGHNHFFSRLDHGPEFSFRDIFGLKRCRTG